MTRTQRLSAGAAILAALLVVVGLVGIVRTSGGAMRTITADFPEAPGLYVDNHVEVLGIPIGQVTAVTAHPTYVQVTMVVRADVPIPATADALLEAPDVVNDRFVELNPAYSGGPRLAAGATIPKSRTAVPISTDQILGNLDQLVKDLGPNGANQHGAVSEVIAQLARTLGGNGPNLNRTITSVGQALGALAADGPQLKSLLDNLGTFTRSAAADSDNYQAFVNDLAAVSSELAADNTDIGGALHNLQLALGALAQFVADNRVELGGAVSNLDTFFATLAREQKELSGTLGIAPTALANISDAIDTTAPGGPALVSRYDPTTGSTTVTNQVCGNTLLRLLVVTVNPQQATPLDVTCGFSSVIENLGAPPNSPSGPSASLSSLAGAGR
jgi:phospholipid/cholesterol/gamma-HCH transport system substrate-binding protein